MYHLYLSALLAIKKEERDPTVGICHNLFMKVGSPPGLSTAQFYSEACEHIFGKVLCWPIEGSIEEHHKYVNKFDPDTNPYAQERLKVLDKMIQYCLTKKPYVLVYSIGTKEFKEVIGTELNAKRRAKELRNIIGYNYEIKQG